MSPSIEDIMRYRHLARCVLRLFGVVFAGLGVVPLASWGMEGIRDGDIFDIGYYAPRAVMSVLFLGFAIAFTVLDRVLAVWIVPMPSSTCPGCFSTLDPRGVPRCPECGLMLVSRTDVPPHDEPPGRRVEPTERGES